MASAVYVNERPILGCRVRALNDRLCEAETWL